MEARLKEIHQWIVEGKLSWAKRALQECSTMKVSGIDQAIELASLYRRVDWNGRGLKVLAPFVVGRGRLLPQVNADAQIEYADCLRNLGLLNEARKILLTPELKKNPRARFALALSYLHDYELEKAESLLFDLRVNSLKAFSPYQQAIISVNLLIAMLRDLTGEERQQQFQAVFAQIEKECIHHRYQLLLGHLSVIQLQFKVLTETAKEADLEEAGWVEDLPEFSRKTAELYLLLGKNQIGEHDQKIFLKRIKNLREECLQLRLFEVVREIDFHQARVIHQVEHLQTVFLKTIFPCYRNKIASLSKEIKTLSCARLIQNLNFAGSDIFDFNLEVLKDEPLLVRALMVMSEEQYVPLSTNFLWNALMPDRHYIEPSSRQSIHQLVKRLRQFLKMKKIPLQIILDQTGYRLVAHEKKQVRLFWPENWSPVEIQNQSLNFLSFFKELRSKFMDSPFRLSEVMKLFPDTSRRTIQFFLVKAVNENRVEKYGKNKGAYYAWSAQQSP